MIARLQEVTDKSAQGQTDEVGEMLESLQARLATIDKDEPTQPTKWDEHQWDRFLFGITGEWREEEDGSWEPRYEWGQWELDSPQVNHLGYTRFLLETRIPRGGGTSAHYYSQPPPAIDWSLTPIVQKSVRFFIGKARVDEIDAVCSVPQLPAEVDSSEAGLRVLDRGRGDKEWQRRIEARRVLAIRGFIGDKGNIIANSAILYAPPHPAVAQSRNGRLRVAPSRFLRREQGQWSDHQGKTDLRPIWLIDGQHRVRGLAQSEEGINLEIPIIVFPPGFSLGQSAKIFAEINTLQKKLSPLHTLFMQHRFGIPSPVAKRDFTRPYSDKNTRGVESRANHLAYQCAAYLTSHPDGPMEGRIRILDQNAPRFTIVQASQWVDFSRDWYLPGGIYEPSSQLPEDSIHTEVENFFSALISTCNHDEWDDGLPRWSPTAKNKGLLQRHGPSQALLRLYPTVWMKASQGTAHSPFSKERFLRVMRPLKWVDWLDERLLPLFGASGERPRTALRIWMENAVEHGTQYPLEQVMTDSLHSQPGRGMLASPGDSEVKVIGGQQWPEECKPVYVRSIQPVNTLSGSRWTIIDSAGVNRSPENPILFAKDGHSDLVLRHAPWIDAIDSLNMRVDWYNTVNPPGKGQLTLEKK